MITYEGNENYIFVSYAHKDSKTVIPIVEALHESGFRVWYDSGIEAGTEWPAYIEEHIDACARVIVFMSPASVNSVNCRNEVNYALSIKKEMLIIFIEETTLAKGMGLQLNSLQTLFMYRHSSSESFFEALTEAKIIQCCRIGSDEDISETRGARKERVENITKEFDKNFEKNTTARINDRAGVIESRRDGPSVISTIGSVPTNDPNDLWPAGHYSNIIDIDKYSIVLFHCRLVRAYDRDTFEPVTLQVYDIKDNLVHESTSNVMFRKGNDKIAKNWIVKDSYGMAQSPGSYTAVMWIGDSRAMEYKFIIRATRNASSPNSTSSTTQKTNDIPYTGEAAELYKKLQYPSMFRKSLAAFLFFIFGLAMIASDVAILGIALFIVALVFAFKLYKATYQNLIKSKIISFLVVFVFGGYYGLVLLVLAIITAINKREWTSRLNQLK